MPDKPIKYPPPPLRIATVYALIGALWILLSDRVLSSMIDDLALLTRVQTYKGWAFVAITAVLLYWVIDRYNSKMKHSDAVLIESEERFRTFAENAQDMIYRMSLPDGRYEYVSPASVAIFGYSPQEFYDSPVLIQKLIHPDWQGYFREQWDNLLSGKMPPFYEYQIIHKSAEVKWLHQRNVLILDREGRPIAIEGAVTDITGRKRAEETLRESEARYRKLFEYAPDGIVIADSESYYIDANASMCRMLGYSRDELIGLHASDIVAQEEIQHIGPALSAIKSKSEYHREWQFRRKDGSTFAAEVISTMMPDGNLLGMIRDITEHKRADQLLHESEARLSILVETIPDLIWLKDVDGIYLTCNKMFEQFLGAKESEIVGRTDYDFVKKESADFFRDHDRKVMAAGKPMSNTKWITFASDGHRVFLNTIKTPMYDREGKLLGVLGIGRDITEYRKLEEQLRQSQKMEAIGTLAGGIAHDFNNILTAIIGYGHITLMKMPKNDPLRLNIEHMLSSADRAAALTQSLLTFSRKRTTNRMPVDLNIVLRKLEKFLVRIIGEDVVVRLALAESALYISADTGQLEQVFMNLAANARDAMPNGGSFTIETSIIEVDRGFVSAHGYGKPGAYVLIVVTDTGVGFTRETKEKIFEPFFTTKEVGKGTGLGLAMIYGILKQHEGFINVYSEPGKGTTFRIYLPLITIAAVEEQKTIAAEYPKGGTETILLAEDDVNLRKLNVLVLEQMGYAVITANDGEEAVTKFMENTDRIQLLLFDIIMPKKNGREAYEEIRKVKPNVPVIFASGYSPDMLREKALIEEGAAIVYKPSSPMDLSKKVREVLDRK